MIRIACFVGSALLTLSPPALAKDFAWSWSRWSVVTQGVLLDSQTGLQWTQEDNKQDIDWSGAQQYCLSSTYAEGAWRLPTADELIGIWDEKAPGFECHGMNGAKCKISSLFHLTSNLFWSSSETGNVGGDGSALVWEIAFYNRRAGREELLRSNFLYSRALCVRSARSPL